MDGTYTGKQFTDEDDKNILDAYFLLNANISYELKLDTKNKIRFSGIIQNILNTTYQSSWGYAMPGINYRISLTYQFN